MHIDEFAHAVRLLQIRLLAPGIFDVLLVV